MQAAGIVPDDPLADPSDFAMDLRREIQTAFAVALWRKFRQGTYLAAWNSAHDELIATIEAMPEEERSGGRVSEIAWGLASGESVESERRELYAWAGFLVDEVLAPRQRRVQEELDRLAGEEARLRERITCDQDRLSDAQARELLARAQRHPELVDGGETHLVPAESRWARFRPARNNCQPIRDPADLDGRKAAMIAKLESDVAWETADLRKDSKLLPTSLVGKPGQ